MWLTVYSQKQEKSEPGPSGTKVSRLDFELRKVRGFQNTSCAVRTRKSLVLTPLSMRDFFVYDFRLIYQMYLTNSINKI